MDQQIRGKLSLCATPIGNLEDITLRVLRTLREADAIWAEDTRRTLGLLNHYEIRKPLISCHEHNERERAEMLVAAVRGGSRIAYCSDAGMPGISDPGALLLKAVVEAGLPVEVLPGASAVLTAVVLCGLPSDTFAFFGFLPRGKKPRRERLKLLADCPHLAILYESPLRLPATLKELAIALGEERPAAVMRELTKLHEEAVRGTLSELCMRFQDPPKGECVIAIGRNPAVAAETDPEALQTLMAKLLHEGLSVNDAAKEAALKLGVPKKEAYRVGLTISG